jgi:hypothetical protein
MAEFFIFHGSGPGWADEAYVTGLVWLGILLAVAIVGVLVFVPRMDDAVDDSLGLLFCSVGVLLWPLALTITIFAGVIWGLRAVVHGDIGAALARRSTTVGRRDARIAALEAENVRLERELGLGESNPSASESNSHAAPEGRSPRVRAEVA